MIDNLLQSQAIVADGPIFPGTWAYYDGIEHLNYDKEEAINLIKKAPDLAGPAERSLRGAYQQRRG
jgi:hypothetical protein